ncbi:prolipoprotein diacylglyceryl transferase [Oceanirhabdus seepicola]|uniref:Phosphatidylglycerol--prolipoprotein diacylglyceryl transferase n=1 Tax=Oceanirhabdus seepicola TaxID=2828781 RepID=A0A9J6P1R4_9CLOT|nr:prolipoprotein diacylglyceryl transferase [Oceanirhabdus seepicola]MCM1990559.1 prolipoprotein diacylglyceryl transferase [Oceanirhabdus seepicola]
MDPVAFELFGIKIAWYGILISLGMLIALVLSNYTSKLKKINYDLLLNAILIALPCAIIGARLYYVLFSLDYYLSNPIQILNIRQGGLAIHGGLIFGIGSGVIYLLKKKENIIKYIDATVPCIVIAQAIGRWGNFMNGEAHGGEVTKEFISRFPEFIQKGMFINGAYYHPTFLYESVLNVGIFIVLMIMLFKKVRDGYTAFTYIGLYSLGRFFIEGMRTDSLYIGGMRIAQIVSLLGVAAWIGFIIYDQVKRKKQAH